MTQLSDEHHLLKADLDAAARALGVVVTREQHLGDSGKRSCTVQVALPTPTRVSAKFVRENTFRRAEKLFVHEVECGSAWFDDLVFVITSTREATSALLANKRVQQALILLVDDDRHVEIEGDTIKLVDHDAHDDGRDAIAELLAIAKYVTPVAA